MLLLLFLLMLLLLLHLFLLRLVVRVTFSMLERQTGCWLLWVIGTSLQRTVLVQ